MSNVNLISLLATVLAGWVNRHQQAIIDYLIEENRIFKQQLNGRRLKLSDNDRRRLAAKAKALGREVLDEVANLVTPDTLLACMRRLTVKPRPKCRVSVRPRTKQKLMISNGSPIAVD